MSTQSRPFHLAPIIIGLFSLILFVYSNYRAFNMGMTHDESSTFINYANTNIWSCLNDPRCFGTANNHLLNTILFQQTTNWFGLSEWSMRLPNLLAHLLYLLSTGYLVCLLSKQTLMRITGFVLLNFNPYLLDFFVVARGYGLAMGLILVSITGLFLYANDRRNRWVWLLFSFAFLSVLAVFTSLIYWLTAWGTLVVIQLYFIYEKEISWKQAIQSQLIPLGFTLLLAVMLYQPIQWLQRGGEFHWGAPNIYHTYYHLVVDSLYNLRYLGNGFNNKLFFQILTGVFLLLGIVLSIVQLRIKKKTQKNIHFIIASVLLLFPVLVIILQYYILGSLFLVNRKSLLFIPLAGILVFLTVDYLFERHKPTGILLAIVLVGFSLIHYGRSFRVDSCREWWYDVHTKQVATILDQKGSAQDTLRVGTHWMFHPSLEFYRLNFVSHPWKKTIYSKKLLRDSTFDFYYIFRSDYKHLKTHYVPIDTLSFSFFLLENRKRIEKE